MSYHPKGACVSMGGSGVLVGFQGGVSRLTFDSWKEASVIYRIGLSGRPEGMK